MSSSSYWAIDENTNLKQKLMKGLYVGAATWATAMVLPLSDAKAWIVNPLNLLSNGVALSPPVYLGLAGVGSSIASDYAHDMILHNLGLSPSVEQNYSAVLQFVVGAVSSLGVMYTASPGLPSAVGPLLPMVVGGGGELLGSYASKAFPYGSSS